MNKGTKVRTILLIVAILNQANVNIGVWEFGNAVINIIYKVISYLLTLGAAVAAWYFNNDFTEEACIGTGITRQLKAEKKAGYTGDHFFNEDDEDPGEDDAAEPAEDDEDDEIEEAGEGDE